MEKSDALKYWRDFEKFVLDYLIEKYNITNQEFAILTPPSGDGGYDGVLYSSFILPEKGIREILFEAKLRSSLGNSLPLNDFSKALIIAINRFTDEVYIATNIIFSPDTLHQLKVYSERVGICIETLNGKTLYEWYERQNSDKKSKYNMDFIAFLKKSSEAIPTSVYVNNQQTESNVIDIYEYVRDIDRNKQISLIKAELSCYSGGLALFSGNQGCGKSCLCAILKKYLQEKSYQILDMDMYVQNTSRTIFLKLLEGVWGFSSDIIINSTEKEVREVFSKIGAETLTTSDIECLQFIFSKEIKEYNGNSDIYQYILLNIVEKLFKHYSNRIPYCIHIHNMESAFEESCDFIQKLITRLSFCNIFFFVEIRDNYAGEMKITLDEWECIQHRLHNSPRIIGDYIISNFSLLEAASYIKRKLPLLKDEQVKELAQLLPDNPLILDAALRILKPKIEKKVVLDSEFKREMRYFNKNYDCAILKELLRNIMHNKESERLIIPFAMLSLLKGKCSIENIVKISEEKPIEIKKLLCNTGLVSVDKDIISIKHEFYINTLQNYSIYIPNILLQELAKKMISNIELFYQDVIEQWILYVKLLDICHDYMLLLTESNKVGKALRLQGDNNQALDIYKKGYRSFEAKCLDSKTFTLQKLDILENMISIKWNTAGGYDDELEALLGKFHLLIRISRKDFKHHIRYIEACIYESFFEMKKMHMKSEHKKCLRLAYKAKRLARKHNGYENFPLVFEHVLWLKSLSIKHVSGMEACLKSFECDIKKNPKFSLLYSSYNTHKAASIAGVNPRLALRYFKLNEKYYITLSMAEQLHNRVNIANMYFFLKEYDMAKEMTEELIIDALSYDINIELGRAYNTLGNCYAVMDDINNSVEFYRKSILIFQKIEHSIHLWSPLVNCASSFVIEENYVDALVLLKEALPIFIKRCDELANSTSNHVTRANKLLIGIIITLYLLRCISSTFQEAMCMHDMLLDRTRKYMPEQINAICSDKVIFKKYFENTVYEHQGKILLKL